MFLGCSLEASGDPAYGSKRYAVSTRRIGCHRHSRHFRRQRSAKLARRTRLLQLTNGRLQDETMSSQHQSFPDRIVFILDLS